MAHVAVCVDFEHMPAIFLYWEGSTKSAPNRHFLFHASVCFFQANVQNIRHFVCVMFLCRINAQSFCSLVQNTHGEVQNTSQMHKRKKRACKELLISQMKQLQSLILGQLYESLILSLLLTSKIS